jgi:outer membrane protein assembly complex protein YaeT
LKLLRLSSGDAFVESDARQDLRRLHETGFFEQIRIDARPVPDGRVDIVIQLRELPHVSSFAVEGISDGLHDRIMDMLRQEKLEPRSAAPLNPVLVRKAAVAVRDMLRAQKYPHAEIRVDVRPEPSRQASRVILQVSPGAKLKVGRVEFDGNDSVSSGELLSRMEHTPAGPFWALWSNAGCYIPEYLRADLERIRRHYQTLGFAAVRLGSPEIVARYSDPSFPLRNPRPELHIRIPVHEGPLFTLNSVRLEGNAGAAAAQLAELVQSIGRPARYDVSVLESIRKQMSDALGRSGYPMADVQLAQSLDEQAHSVDAVYKVEAGLPATIGRIRFEGNRHVPDRFLRRELTASEGSVYDSSKLDQSIERLNKSNLVRDMGRSDVALELNENTRELDVTFKVRENGRQGIYGTGGMANGGYLGILYSVFNLFGIAERLTLELDGGAAQSNYLLNLAGRHFLGFPFSIGMSAFHRLTDLNVAGIVPDGRDLVGVFKKRTTGAGLSGSYPVSTHLEAALAYQYEAQTITTADSKRRFGRSHVTPALVLDATRGSGADTRGFKLAFARSWTGSGFFESVEYGREMIRIARFQDDPFTAGRNSFAFQLQGALAHSGSRILPEDQRFYPGTELARGYPTGGLSAWAPDPGSSGLRAAGTSSYAGFSAEYRVPIHGALSGTVFFDLAWTALEPRQAGISASSILKKTSGVLRASTGGELLLQLPVIRQPARLIFAWNPLRLDTLLSGESALRLADPRGAVRVALGDVF